MGFRLRRSARLGPLRFNFSSGGLSSISVGGRGASFNIPVNRSGGPRTTVGLPNSRRLRAQGQDDAKRRAQRCITAVQEASRLASGRGWLS